MRTQRGHPDELFTMIRTVVDPSALLTGAEDGWLAPIGVFQANRGFDESAWVAELPTTTIAFRISGAQVTCQTPACAGRSSGSGRSIGLQPAGTTNASICAGPVRFAQIYFPDDLLDRVGDELGTPRISQQLRDDLWFFKDDHFERLVHDYVVRSLDRRTPASRLEMEARSVLVLEHLVTRYHRAARAVAVQGGLAPWQLRTICDFLEANIARKVSLAELSALSGLSVYHLCRAFCESTGLPPYRWWMRRRIGRAEELLQTSAASITEVAAAVGYDDPGQFATAFRKHVGVSPSRYRRERRS